MNKTSKNTQNGFTIIEILLIIAIIGIVGFAGYFVYSQRSDSNQLSTPAAETTLNTSSSAEPSAESSGDSNFINIPDWNVKIGLGEYSRKVKISSASQFENTSTVQITILPEFSENSDCETYVAFSRTEPPLSLKVGVAEAIDSKNGFTYYSSAVSECGGATPSTKANTVSIRDLLNAFSKYGVE